MQQKEVCQFPCDRWPVQKGLQTDFRESMKDFQPLAELLSNLDVIAQRLPLVHPGS